MQTYKLMLQWQSPKTTAALQTDRWNDVKFPSSSSLELVRNDEYKLCIKNNVCN